MPRTPPDPSAQAAPAALSAPAFATRIHGSQAPTRHGVHGHTRHQRLRHDPRLHLIRPLPVPTAPTASREKLQCRLHGKTPSQQSSRSNEPIRMPRRRWEAETAYVSRPLRHTALCPLPLRHPRSRRSAYADAAGARYSPPFTISAQTMRAILLASATRTSIGGLRDSIPPSHVRGRAEAWTCRLMMTLLAPMISSRRRDRSPILVVAPRRCLPPVECWRGTSPSQAAKSRALRKVSDGASFHRHSARRQLSEKLQHLRSPQLLAQNRAACAIGTMDLKHILRQIETDSDNLRHDRSPLWSVADPPWHTDAAGGRLHHQSQEGAVMTVMSFEHELFGRLPAPDPSGCSRNFQAWEKGHFRGRSHGAEFWGESCLCF